MFKPGDHVWADFGDGKVLAHVATGKQDTADGDKYGVQAPDGSVHSLAYREPDDRDAAGSGLTFWKI